MRSRARRDFQARKAGASAGAGAALVPLTVPHGDGTWSGIRVAAWRRGVGALPRRCADLCGRGVCLLVGRDARLGLHAQLRFRVGRVAVATVQLHRLLLITELLVGLGEVVEERRDLADLIRALEQLDGARVVRGPVRLDGFGGELLDLLRGRVIGERGAIPSNPATKQRHRSERDDHPHPPPSRRRWCIPRLTVGSRAGAVKLLRGASASAPERIPSIGIELHRREELWPHGVTKEDTHRYPTEEQRSGLSPQQVQRREDLWDVL